MRGRRRPSGPSSLGGPAPEPAPARLKPHARTTDRAPATATAPSGLGTRGSVSWQWWSPRARCRAHIAAESSTPSSRPRPRRLDTENSTAPGRPLRPTVGAGYGQRAAPSQAPANSEAQDAARGLPARSVHQDRAAVPSAAHMRRLYRWRKGGVELHERLARVFKHGRTTTKAAVRARRGALEQVRATPVAVQAATEDGRNVQMGAGCQNTAVPGRSHAAWARRAGRAYCRVTSSGHSVRSASSRLAPRSLMPFPSILGPASRRPPGVSSSKRSDP